MSKLPPVSIIIISKNEGHNLKQTIEHLAIAKTDIAYEIIVVDDGSVDSSVNFLQKYENIKVLPTNGVGPAQARNLGSKSASGEIYIFLDAHIIPRHNWLDDLLIRFEIQDVTAVAPILGAFNPSHPDVYGVKLDKKLQPYWVTQPITEFSPIPFAGAGCLAVRAQTFKALNGFDNGIKGIGYGDIDFCFRLWMFGFNIYLEPSVRILHHFRKSKPYKVQPQNITYNLLRMAFKLFSEDKIAAVINIAKDSPDFGNTLMDILRSNVWEERLSLHAKRQYDDQWFFKKFSLSL